MTSDTTEMNILKPVALHPSKAGLADMNPELQNHLTYMDEIYSPRPSCSLLAGMQEIKLLQESIFDCIST